MKSKATREDIIFDTINYTLLIILMIVTLYPFLNTIAVSLNDSVDSIRGGIHIWPRKFTTINYSIILKNQAIYHAAFISSARAIIGALLNVTCSLVVGYALSRQEFVLRKLYSRIFVFSMYISAGLIPSYFLIMDLHLRNNFLVYILPGVVSAFNIMVVRSYIAGLPPSLIESAKIDGASELKIIFSIVMPLSVPVLATVILFVSVGQWNSWFDTMLYCSNANLSTLQFELQKVLQSSLALASTQSGQLAALKGANGAAAVTPNSLRAAMTIVAILPILAVYPYLQKYFVKGLTLGGVKG
ncbi:MAG TPA: carbohydrate ABC transporter permease [Clostridiaceae bacterium]